MICEICGAKASEEKKVHLSNKRYTLCSWCQMRVMQYVHNNTSHEAINIYWGAGHVCTGSWGVVQRIVRKYKFKDVLEMGIGLSSELFVNEGLDLVGIDILKEHVSLYQKLIPLRNKAKFYWYPAHHLPDFDKLYPGRKWDFVFVDGPQRRADEVRLAMKLSSRFIFLHDPNLGEEDFFPNEEWKVTDEYFKMFEKV